MRFGVVHVIFSFCRCTYISGSIAAHEGQSHSRIIIAIITAYRIKEKEGVCIREQKTGGYFC
jgi:hypothetical protein